MTARAFAPLVIAALGAHLLDAIITAVGITRGIPEDNPVQLVVYRFAGLGGMDLLKLALVGLCVGLLWRVRGRYRAWQVWLAVLCLMVPAMAVSALNALTIRGG